MVDWWLDFKLWENPRVFTVLVLTKEERLKRMHHAVLAKAYSRGCTIILVDFGGKHEHPQLTTESTT